jgi:hypothetical protein
VKNLIFWCFGFLKISPNEVDARILGGNVDLTGRGECGLWLGFIFSKVRVKVLQRAV